ncbi:hypothetical protein Cgig2_010423 [Carnegiea gigantea]|uniref:Uncharacterized protein n=1 Tax=Carnegiea gigantea TaxID=171969 RepID=A0A9Q1K470_9CARY|nr:hypothetical protein Cgig2_010423 [Carnegiea gigantea]
MRTLKSARVVAEQPTNNAPLESSKVRRALFQSNTSRNQVGRSPMLLKGSVVENSSRRPINDSSGMMHSPSSSKRNGNQEILAIQGMTIHSGEGHKLLLHYTLQIKLMHLDSYNPRHDYPSKRRKDNDTSLLSTIDQPDASNGISALSLRTLRSSQKRVPLKSRLQ